MKEKGLSKSERTVSKKLLDALFKGGGRSIAAYPLRLVYMPLDSDGDTPRAEIMVSVSKRHFKRAVKRNRCKRHVREAYRLNKHIVYDALTTKETKSLALAFIWLSDELQDYATVEHSMTSLLNRMAEKIS